MAKKRQKKYLFFIALVLAAAVIVSGVFILALKSASSGKVTLDAEYYGTSGSTFIKKEQYEQMIKDKKSFIVSSSASLCNSNILDYIDTFSSEENISFVSINWAELKGTNAAETIKFPPTIFIVEKGNIRAYLDSDAEKDVEKYNNYEEFAAWMRENLDF